ncbi:MAG: CatA-like O-acetyltransferase [Halanaerobiales bacterium]
MKKIDMENWNREQHFDFFNKFDYPHFNITVDIEISKLKNYTSKNNISFFKSMVFLVAKNANEIKESKYRIIDDNQVVILEKVKPSFTIMKIKKVFLNIWIRILENLKKIL